MILAHIVERANEIGHNTIAASLGRLFLLSLVAEFQSGGVVVIRSILSPGARSSGQGPLLRSQVRSSLIMVQFADLLLLRGPHFPRRLIFRHFVGV